MTLAILFLPFIMMAQTQYNFNKIQKVKDGMYFMYYDTSAIKQEITKSTIIEFKEFIALIDVPILQQGGGAKKLKDHTIEGKQIIQSLKKYFPKKPLKYVLSSHWHPHSISSVLPFITNKTTLITTSSNFKKIQEFVDSSTYNFNKKYFLFIDKDSFIIEDKSNKIVVYNIKKEDYPSVPTKDFLYFYFPRYNVLNSACMYWRLNTKIKEQELIYDRLFDLNKFLIAKNIHPNYFTRYTEDSSTNGLVPMSELNYVLKNGISNAEINEKYLNIKDTMSDLECSIITKKLIEDKVPNSIINSRVYNYLEKKDLKKALTLAKIQTQIQPSDANVWDTYGEVLYFIGEVELANYYDKQAQVINPNFKDGGIDVWKEDLKTYQKLWLYSNK